MNRIEQQNQIIFGRTGEFSHTNTKFSTKIVKFSFFFNVSKNSVRYLIAFIVGVIMGVATLLFVEVTGLYAGGSAAFLQGIARLVYVAIQKNVTRESWTYFIYNLLFWGMYLTMNILIFILLYKKLNRQCIIITSIYLITAQIVGFLLSLIPNISEFTIFGNTSTVNKHLGSYGVQCIIYNPNIWPHLDPRVYPDKYDWSIDQLTTNPYIVSESIKQDIFSSNIIRSFLLIVYGFVFSIITAISNAILYIIGGSSAGTEMVALYVSEEKNKDVSYLLKTSQSLFLLFGAIIGSYICGIVVNVKYYCGWQYIINANMVGSLVWILANAFFLEKLFPSQKIVKMEIFTHNSDKIINNLKKYKCSNPITIISSTGANSGIKNNILVSALPLFEVSTFVKVVRMVDKNCLITTCLLDDCDGRIILQKHKSVEEQYNITNARNKAISLICEHLKIDEKTIKSITLQSQGWTNKVFLFKLKNHEKYIVRIATVNELLKRSNEIAVLKLLSINNKVDFVFIDNKTGDFIKKYIEGKMATKLLVKKPEFLKLLAYELKKLHNIKIPVNCQIEVNDIHIYDQYDKNIDLKYRKKFDDILEKQQHLKKCICHHDLTPWNIIYNAKKHSLSLIDFEWSRINTPYFDLANFIRETNIHSTKYEKIFLDAYDKKINHSIITDYLYVSSYFSYLWTYSVKAYKHILNYRAKMFKLIKKYYQEITQNK